MRYRALGRSGLVVSVVGLGCNNFGRRLDQEQTTAVVDACFDHGVTLFDTADIYGGQGASETLLGHALKGRRDEVVLATKFGMDMQGANGEDFGARGSRRYVRRAVEASLRRLQTDHIDLYQYHRPDGVTPVEETLTALHELVGEGKVRYIGSSNFPAWLVAEASWVARERRLTPFVSEQSELSLLRRDAERELLPACEHYGVGVLPYFPLASGLLTGKYRRGQAAPTGTRLAEPGREIDDRDLDVVEALEKYAEQRGIGILDVAIGGLAARPAVASVIAGATRPEQVAANVVAGEWVPTDEDVRALDETLGSA
jgi:aryl-alcohol dehydrogenase-like predicted oxidoreductase